MSTAKAGSQGLNGKKYNQIMSNKGGVQKQMGLPTLANQRGNSGAGAGLAKASYGAGKHGQGAPAAARGGGQNHMFREGSGRQSYNSVPYRESGGNASPHSRKSNRNSGRTSNQQTQAQRGLQTSNTSAAIQPSAGGGNQGGGGASQLKLPGINKKAQSNNTRQSYNHPRGAGVNAHDASEADIYLRHNVGHRRAPSKDKNGTQQQNQRQERSSGNRSSEMQDEESNMPGGSPQTEQGKYKQLQD